MNTLEAHVYRGRALINIPIPFFVKGGRNEMREPFKCIIKGFVSQVKYTSSDQEHC